jgi:hypothetical protein
MTLRRAIRKLHLRDGDIILLDRSIPIEQIIDAGRSIKTLTVSVPIVYVNNKNDIRRLPFAELEKIYSEAKKSING